MDSIGQQVIREWYLKKNWEQFPFQKEMEQPYLSKAIRAC
jgi:ATP-dependent Lhr-like helicase